MPLQSAIPILAFLNLEETAAFYRKIGFTVNTSWKEYLMCSRDGIEIHLWKCDNPDRRLFAAACPKADRDELLPKCKKRPPDGGDAPF